MFNFRLAEEPVRRRNRPGLQYYKAVAQDVDFGKRSIKCVPFVEDLSRAEPFHVSYDKIVIAPGCDIQTFGTPGAEEHALFVKTTNDARLIQQRLLQMLDAASLPGVSEERQREILTVRIVGAGAIGIEVTAELYDLWSEDMRHLYSHLDGKFTIAIHDIAPTVLSTFDKNLSEYALNSLREKKVKIFTSSHIERVEQDAIFTKDDGRLPYGMLIWATGNKTSPLVETLPVKRPEKGQSRILTDNCLRVLDPDSKPIENVYAAGDAADIDGDSLPQLAEVAVQKAEYIVDQLNNPGRPVEPFKYTQRALLAYLGQHDGIIGGRETWTGNSAWLAWRSGSLGWTRSWRRKMMISISWLFNWIGGRDIARKW